MNSSTILNRHTDFISDSLSVYCWGFSVKELKKVNSSDYSIPVRIAVLKSLESIRISKCRRIRNRAFTVFIGDYDEGCNRFAFAIRYSTDKRIKRILSENCSKLSAFFESFEDNIRYIHLIPEYRYSFSRIYQYTYDDSKIGSKDTYDLINLKIDIRYRRWLSAEEYSMKEKYIS